MDPLARLKAHVVELAQQPPFVHASWFVDHHLLILEQLVNELCDRYPAANRTHTLALVWLHDYGKIVTNKGANEDEVLMPAAEKLMRDVGFQAVDIEQTLKALHEMEHVRDMTPDDMMIEAKIMSSADAASHFIGPFFSLYWYEMGHKTPDQLIADNMKKIDYDFNVKAVLPEVKEFIRPRYEMMREYAVGHRPDRFLSR